MITHRFARILGTLLPPGAFSRPIPRTLRLWAFSVLLYSPRIPALSPCGVLAHHIASSNGSNGRFKWLKWPHVLDAPDPHNRFRIIHTTPASSPSTRKSAPARGCCPIANATASCTQTPSRAPTPQRRSPQLGGPSETGLPLSRRR